MISLAPRRWKAQAGTSPLTASLRGPGIMHASTMVLAFTSPLNVLLNNLLVYRTSLGFLGAPLATSITYWLSFGLLCGKHRDPPRRRVPVLIPGTLRVVYCKLVQGGECWGGWSRQCLQRLGPFFALAVPGIFHVGTEWSVSPRRDDWYPCLCHILSAGAPSRLLPSPLDGSETSHSPPSR